MISVTSTKLPPSPAPRFPCVMIHKETKIIYGIRDNFGEVGCDNPKAEIGAVLLFNPNGSTAELFISGTLRFSDLEPYDKSVILSND